MGGSNFLANGWIMTYLLLSISCAPLNPTSLNNVAHPLSNRMSKYPMTNIGILLSQSLSWGFNNHFSRVAFFHILVLEQTKYGLIKRVKISHKLIRLLTNQTARASPCNDISSTSSTCQTLKSGVESSKTAPKAQFFRRFSRHAPPEIFLKIGIMELITPGKTTEFDYWCH